MKSYLRYKDLKESRIVNNWTTLLRLIEHQDFPPGVRISAQARAWDEAEVEKWLEGRRIPAPSRNDVVDGDQHER